MLAESDPPILRLEELRMWARVARFEGDPGTVDAIEFQHSGVASLAGNHFAREV